MYLYSKSHLCWSLSRCPSLRDRGEKSFPPQPADKHAQTQAHLLRPHCLSPQLTWRRSTPQKVNKREIHLCLPRDWDVEETWWPDTADHRDAQDHRVKGVNYVWSHSQTANLLLFDLIRRTCGVWEKASLSQTHGKRNWSEATDCLRSLRELWLLTTFHESIFAGCIGFSKYCGPHTALIPAESGNRDLSQLYSMKFVVPVMTQHKAGRVTIIFLERFPHTFTLPHQ